jgi:hypothetical protein
MDSKAQFSVLLQFVGLIIGIILIILSVEVITQIVRFMARALIAWVSRNMPKTYEQLNRVGIK